MTDLEFLKFVLYGDSYMESLKEEEEQPTSEEKSEETEQNNIEAEVTDSDTSSPSSNAEINKRIDNMVTGYISNMNQQVSKGFKMRTKDSSGREITARTNISIVPLGGSKPVLDQQNKTLKFKVKINKDSSAETGASRFFRGANAILGAVPADDSSTWLTK